MSISSSSASSYSSEEEQDDYSSVSSASSSGIIEAKPAFETNEPSRRLSPRGRGRATVAPAHAVARGSPALPVAAPYRPQPQRKQRNHKSRLNSSGTRTCGKSKLSMLPIVLGSLSVVANMYFMRRYQGQIFDAGSPQISEETAVLDQLQQVTVVNSTSHFVNVHERKLQPQQVAARDGPSLLMDETAQQPAGATRIRATMTTTTTTEKIGLDISSSGNDLPAALASTTSLSQQQPLSLQEQEEQPRSKKVHSAFWSRRPPQGTKMLRTTAAASRLPPSLQIGAAPPRSDNGALQSKRNAASFLKRLWNRNLEKGNKATEGDRKVGSESAALDTSFDSSTNQHGEEQVPINQNVAPGVNVAACLYLQDGDLSILNEWLAYHYHALNLRRVIVAVDPSSKFYSSKGRATNEGEALSSLLTKWSLLTGDLQITKWLDEADYMPTAFIETKHVPQEHQLTDNITMSKDAIEERYRRRGFLGKCLKQHQEHKQKTPWVLHVNGPDEFVVLQKRSDGAANKRITRNPGSVVKALQLAVEADAAAVSYPCMSLSRLTFGTFEAATHSGDATLPPPPADFDATQFLTLNFLSHDSPKKKQSLLHPSVLVDVSRVKPDAMLGLDVVPSVEQPLGESLCRNANEQIGAKKLPLATHRYIGPPERYTATRGPRSRIAYGLLLTRTSYKTPDSDASRFGGWIHGFAATAGREMAIRLMGRDYLSKSGLELATSKNLVASTS